MSEFAQLFKDLNNNLKETLVSIVILGSFWVIPFILFKPEFFTFPFYAQIALIFALTVVWHIATLLATFHFLDMSLREDASPIPMNTMLAIVLLNISILIGYYFSTSFTCFLRCAFGVLIVTFIIQFIGYVIIEAKKSE
ncbi:hypothetical protein [Flavobacterium sp. 3-210]